MSPQDIRSFLTKRPFQPFRLTLTEGRTYDVQHPELAMVGLTTMAIGLPAAGREEPVYDRLVTVSLSHIMHVEPVNGRSASSDSDEPDSGRSQ